MFNKKRLAEDFLYNLLASLIVTGVLQIIVYPVLAKMLSSSAYGVLLTAMGVINTVSLSVGNTLNNTRLIQNTSYLDAKIEGDFHPLLIISSTSSSIVILIIVIFMFDFSSMTYVLLMVLVFLLSTRSYYIVQYRLVLDFRKNLICNIYLAAGYVIGLFLSFLTGQWPLVFITAEIMGLIYLKRTSNLFSEKFALTANFKITLSKFCMLAVVTLSTNVMLYLDRMIIYPVLGSESVSVYTVAVFFGKTLGILITPIASVLLGYFSQKGFRITVRQFWLMNGAVIAIAVCFMGISTVFAPFFTKLLYPTLYASARPYIFYANLAAVMGVVASMAQPAVLKFAPTYWQIIKEVIYAAVYLCLGILFLQKYSLMGFCVASILANLSKVIVLYVIGTVQFSRK